MEDGCKLDDVREGLQRVDGATAARLGDVFALTPIAVAKVSVAKTAPLSSVARGLAELGNHLPGRGRFFVGSRLEVVRARAIEITPPLLLSSFDRRSLK